MLFVGRKNPSISAVKPSKVGQAGGQGGSPGMRGCVAAVDIECLCTLVVLCGAFAVITSAVSFPG